MEDHKAAQILYNQDVSQKDIARIMHKSEQTITEWKQKYTWKEKKAFQSFARETAEEYLWELINYQLEAHRAQIQEWKKNKKKNDAPKLIDKGEVDALTKMFSAVKGKQLEWTNYVKICRELVTYTQSEDLGIAKQMMPFIDSFLNSKRTEL